MHWLFRHGGDGRNPHAPTPDNIGPGGNLPIPPANNHPYVNGMKDPVEGGFVTLQAAELARSKCLASGNPKLISWAKTVLPFRWAIKDAETQPEFAMSDEDKFSNFENQQFARQFLFRFDPSLALEKVSWCPQAFVAKYPTAHRLYDQGPALTGYASFGPSVGIADVLVLLGNAMDAAGK
jgi:hypothetical protein